MALLEINWRPTQRELRQFAILWIVFFSAIGGYILWRTHSTPAAGAWWAIAAIGLIGVVRPSFLRFIYMAWMFLAWPIGWTVSHLMMAFIFYLIVTPIAVVMRLLGYDPLFRRFDRSAQSYWTRYDPDHGASRYFKQW